MTTANTEIKSARRLSDRKVAISFDMVIRTRKSYMNQSPEHTDSVIDTMTHTFVYRLIEDGTYYPVIKDGFIAKICGKWGIRKKKVIFARKLVQSVTIDGDTVELFTMDCVFLDEEWAIKWHRDRALNQLGI